MKSTSKSPQVKKSSRLVSRKVTPSHKRRAVRASRILPPHCTQSVRHHGLSESHLESWDEILTSSEEDEWLTGRI
jgi:hypothetical protein